METLPREILDRILGDEELAPPDLAAASLACKWIHPSAISKLYRVCRYDHITLPSITLSFRKHGIHTRSLKVKLGFEEPSSEDSPYAGIPIISIFPFFPNLHTFVIEDVQSQPPAYIARILRAVITTNLKLKHLEISCFVLNRTYPEIPAIDPSASSELEQGSAAYAQLDSFGLSIYTSLVNHRVGTGEIVQRLSHFGLALGRSIETVSASAITLRSSLRRPFQPFEPAYPLPANAPIWRFPHLRKLYLSLDCFPHMDIPYMKAEFGKVEVLRVGGQGPPGFVAEDNSDFGVRLGEQFPYVRKIRVPCRDRMDGPEGGAELARLQSMIAPMPRVEIVECVCWLETGLDTSTFSKGAFLVQREPYSVRLLPSREWVPAEEGISYPFVSSGL